MNWDSISDESKRKLSPESKKLLLLGQLPDEAKVNIFLQTSHPPSDRELQEIDEAGGHIQTIAGDVLTGHTTVQDILRLVGLDYVVKLELSLPLFLEEE